MKRLHTCTSIVNRLWSGTPSTVSWDGARLIYSRESSLRQAKVQQAVYCMRPSTAYSLQRRRGYLSSSLNVTEKVAAKWLDPSLLRFYPSRKMGELANLTQCRTKADWIPWGLKELLCTHLVVFCGTTVWLVFFDPSISYILCVASTHHELESRLPATVVPKFAFSICETNHVTNFSSNFAKFRRQWFCEYIYCIYQVIVGLLFRDT